jgi:hypothetical protein
MHTIKEIDMLTAKMDLLLKRLDERAKFKEHMNNYAPVQAIDLYSVCDVCGNGGHSRNDYPETCEDVAFMNNNNEYCPQIGQGWYQPCPPYQGSNNYNSNFNSNQPSLKNLVLGQTKINESLNKKLLDNDKTLESINIKIETLSSALKNHLSLNKMIETQLAQFAAAVPVSERVNAVTMRGGKSTCDPPNPNHAGIEIEPQEDEGLSGPKNIKELEKEMAPQEFVDTSFLPFPTRNQKKVVDEQFLVSLR